MKEGQTILLVDTDERNREVFRAVAEGAGLHLILADDGQEAVDEAGKSPPDLIAIKRNAPILDALAVSVLLKQSDRTKAVPILVICRDASREEAERYRDAGCSGCIQEPFTEKELQERLKGLLP
ncbi:MAG: response regulator [Deltaproteobacteria bacterium]